MMDPEIMDAEWAPWESPTKTTDPERYSKRCRRIRRSRSRRLTTLVERLLAGSALFFLWAVVLALLVGAM